MNNLTFRRPSKFYIVDASEHGLGGWSSHGRAWSYVIPIHLRKRAHINLLEFLASLVGFWIDIIEGRMETQDCILAVGDSTTAMGWLRRTNFREKDKNDRDWIAKQKVGRKVANLILDNEVVLYRQWIAGDLNWLADSLSRDALYLSKKSHTYFLKHFFADQLPANFHLREVPKEIGYFISSTLELLPEIELRSKQPKPSKLLLGNAGQDLLKKLVSEDSNFWTDCQPSKKYHLLCIRTISQRSPFFKTKSGKTGRRIGQLHPVICGTGLQDS